MAKDIDNTFRIQDRDIVLVDSSTEILQRIKNRLATRMGEFFLDTQLGVDWQKTISLTTRNVPPAVTEMEIRRVIGQDEAVKSIENLEIVGNGRTRNISFTVVLQDGSILDSEVTSMGFNQGFTPGGVSDFNNGFIPSSDQFAGFENALFHLTGLNDEQAVDRIGEYFAPDDFVWQGLAIETQGVESYDFNSANDGANFWYYDLGADQEVQATYNHATKWTPVAGVEIAYARFDPTGPRSQGSVYFFEERNGATIYDVINQLHGEILNATEPQLTAIRAARTLQKSYIQQNGFNEVNGVYIPAQDGQFGVDVLGNQLQYIGRIKFNADFVNSNAFQGNGTDNYSNTSVIPVDSEDWKWRFKAKFNTLGGARMGARDVNFFFFGINAGNWTLYYKDQVLDSGVLADTEWNDWEITGNGKVYLNGLLIIDGSSIVGSLPSIPIWLYAINFNSAISAPIDMTLAYSEFENNGSLIKRIVASAGIGDQLYDTDGNEYQIEGTINESTQWVEQDEYHYNIVNGFDAYENTLGERLFVPIGSTVNQAGYAFFDTFIQDGKSLLPCETDISFPQAPALIQADVDNVLFDVSGNPREIDWEDVINATALQEVIGIESTVGNDGQAQAVVPGLTVAYQEYTADVPNGGMLVFSSVSGDDYYDSLNNVIVVGTGSDVTLTNNTGDTADMGVIHMDGQLEGKTVDQMLAVSSTMQPGTDLQHVKNPDLTSTHSDTIQKSIMSIRGTGGADWIGRSNAQTSDKVYTYFRKIVQNINPVDNTTLATPIITDAEITIVDENGASQDYWHLYENGQISGESEDLLPIVKYKNLQESQPLRADYNLPLGRKYNLAGFVTEGTFAFEFSFDF